MSKRLASKSDLVSMSPQYVEDNWGSIVSVVNEVEGYDKLLEKVTKLCDLIGKMWADDSTQDEVKEYAKELREELQK